MNKTDEPIYIPHPAVINHSALTDFTHFCETATGVRFPDQASFQRFSSTDYRAFWRLFLAWSRLIAEGDPEPVYGVMTWSERGFSRTCGQLCEKPPRWAA